MAAPIDMSILVDLFHQGTKLTYGKGEFLIRPGGAPPGIFYIENGLVKAYDITKYGEENLLILRKDGEILGLTWAITGEDRHIIYAALAPTTVWQITRDQFVNFLHTRPEGGLPLIHMLVEMYRLHSERILNLEYRTVRERLISFLLSTARRFGHTHLDGTVTITVPLRHQDIASSISATRETTGRELNALEHRGLLKIEQSIITLRNIAALQKHLE
ncbi:MAG TPA: Crp/Fnr family transcriptional regulator [Candidatus Saccharimonadales bacterium]|jgi:CRP/FNR family transcriptional regulator|nr:Crp/Fnr family transcriptional regulator [Candidatus Saccharimonadales bacterium]